MRTSDLDRQKSGEVTGREGQWKPLRQPAQGDVSFLDGPASVLLESLAEGVVVVDDTGTIVAANSRAGELFGYPDRELVGMPHEMLIPERFRQRHKGYEREFFRAPCIRVMGQLRDLSGLRRDGSEFPLEISLGLVPSGEKQLVLALVSDITIRKHAEQALQQIEELFHIHMACVKDYAIFMLDPQGKVLNWNAGAERLTGYRADEIVGAGLAAFFTPEDRAAGKPAEILAKATGQGQAEEAGWRLRRDGSRFWADEVVTALCEDNGRLRGFSNVMRDIGERKRAEDARRLSEARYRALYDDNPTMIITIDNEFTMLSVNSMCQRQLGYSAEELEGHTVLKLFHEEDCPAVTEQLQMCFQNPNQVYCRQFRKVHKEGGVLWVEETAHAVYDNNSSLNVLVVCHDITERKRAEEALRKSEERFQAIFNLAAVGIAQVSLQGNWLLINQKLCDILGYSMEELQALKVGEICHPEDLERHYGYVRRLLSGEISTYAMERRFLRKGGAVVWVSLNVTLVRQHDGDPGYFIAVIEDVNERKRAEDELRESEEKFSRVFELAPIGITISTLQEGRFVDVNEAGLRLSGYSREEVIGHRSGELNIWLEPTERELMVAELLEKGEVRDREMYLKDRSGNLNWVLYSGVVVELYGEKYLLSLVSDIGERMRAKKELERANELLAQRVAERTAELSQSVQRLQDEILERIRMTQALQEETTERLSVQAELRDKELLLLQQSRLAAMGEMIGNIAHQWRQPLNLLGLLAQDLVMTYRKGDFDDHYLDHAVKKMLDTIHHMSQTIDDFRNFFRPFREKVDFRIVEIVERTISLLEGSLKPQQITAVVQSEDDPVVNGYPNEFSQVLLNIMINARDAFLTHMVEAPTITIRIRKEQERCVVTIADNAGGIPEAIIDRIFDPYFTTKGPDKGTGVGLFMSKTIIEKNMGGSLSARNVGDGAEFRIEL